MGAKAGSSSFTVNLKFFSVLTHPPLNILTTESQFPMYKRMMDVPVYLIHFLFSEFKARKLMKIHILKIICNHYPNILILLLYTSVQTFWITSTAAVCLPPADRSQTSCFSSAGLHCPLMVQESHSPCNKATVSILQWRTYNLTQSKQPNSDFISTEYGPIHALYNTTQSLSVGCITVMYIVK